MTQGPNQQPVEDFEKIRDKLKDMQQYLKEIKLQHCFDTFIIAGLVTVVIQTFSYLLFGPIQSDLQKTLYMFCLLIGPSAFFLFLLHLYDLYGFVKKGEKSIPLSLDLTYFIFIEFAFVTMISLRFVYDQYHVSQKFLTPGWMVGVGLICGEVLFSLVCAKFLVSLFVSHKLPHYFEQKQNAPQKKQRIPQHRVFKPIFKPNQIYYFRKKPDVSLWENEEFFIKYK